MPGPLKNEKHELFAQEIAQGALQLDAYRTAGYAGDECHASRLANRDDVRARVNEMLSKAAVRVGITVASITKRLVAIADKGEKSSEAPLLQVARAALMDAAKLNGLIIDKTQRELSEEQLKLILDTVAANPGMAQQLLAQLS